MDPTIKKSKDRLWILFISGAPYTPDMFSPCFEDNTRL
jgi:hypothetical protein